MVCAACSLKGGFTPSVMGTLLVSGPMLLTAAAMQGKRLVENNKTRMKSRAGKQSRNHKRSNSRRKRSGA